ncbi:hypothetical protein IRY61_00580 [Candidatus Saccharibacteria bacterium]|nr:hypothetical protein [Candidatus Saccharibacteria bacterium]
MQQIREGIYYGLESGVPIEVAEKKPGDHVTDADLWVNGFLRFHLRPALQRGDIHWLSEDDGNAGGIAPKPPQDRRPTFFVDPWDGTNAFRELYNKRLSGEAPADEPLVSGVSICLAFVEPDRPHKTFAIVGMPFTPEGPLLYKIDASGVARYGPAEDDSMGPPVMLEVPQLRQGVEHGVIMSRATSKEFGADLNNTGLKPIVSGLGGAGCAIALIDPVLRQHYIPDFNEDQMQIVANIMRGYPWDCATGYVLSTLHGLLARRWNGDEVDIYEARRGATFWLPGADQISKVTDILKSQTLPY